MDLLIKQFFDLELWEQVLVVSEHLLFLLYFVAVIYLFFFSISSTFRIKNRYPKAKKQYRYAVIFTSIDRGDVIAESVSSFLLHYYPKSHYDIIVVANSLPEETQEELASMPVQLLIHPKDRINKTEAIQFAMSKLTDSMYDVVVIMDADNITDPTFLDKINNAYYCGGMAIQTHRMAKNIDTDTAILDAVSEEINNSIFRRGHVNVGLSSALIGSGMVFNFDWFKDNIHKATDSSLDKQLEAMLLEQYILIEYLDDAYLYGQKASKTSTYYKQRHNWLANRIGNSGESLRKLPGALFKGNYDYCDKLFQWMMPSRTLLMGTLVLISIATSFLAWQLAIKWWAILLLLILGFCIAIPDYMVDSRFVKAMKTTPLLFILTIMNVLRKKLGIA